MKKKWIGAIAIGFTLLVGVALAAAGALNDPLISLEYLQNTFKPSLNTQLDSHVDSYFKTRYEAAEKKLEEVTNALKPQLQSGGSSPWSSSAQFLTRKQNYGDGVTLQTGSSLLFLEGQATADVSGGEIIDTTTGEVSAGNGLYLKSGHRYLLGEQATATVTIQSEAAILAIVGQYQSSAANQATLPFTDISRTAWYYSAISYVYQQNLFGGMSGHQFWPSYQLNRGMLATVLHRMAGSPPAGTSGISFHDVPAGSWYEAGVKWSASVGIVNGMEENAFWPSYNVTREQMAVMLYRYAGEHLKLDVSARGDLSGFPDRNRLSPWAQEGMGWAVSVGIIGGDNLGALNPAGSATRAEAATMIERFARLTGR